MHDVTDGDLDAPRVIPRRERFTPEPIVVRLPEWRTFPDGGGELFVEKTGQWGKIHPMFVQALGALREGHGFEEALGRAERASPDVKPNHVRILLRRFFWQLHEAGHLRIPLEPTPDVFEGRYRVVRTLGRGGVGVAHLCEDEVEKRLVVVKHAWGYQQLIERTDRGMRKEGAVLRALDHPGVARYYGAFEVEGIYHVVREFVDGDPLPARRGLYSDDRAARLDLLARIADIVGHMHERGYLFLDAKPDNFLIKADGTPIVADVGTCRPHVDGLAAYHGQAGSRGYAAPELMARANVGVWSDVFGLACVHQWLLTRRAPEHKQPWEERRAALAAAGVPSDEATLILACCAEDPKDRPGSVQELRARLLALA